jgi:ParB-like chromosome segregation protein Spo0J
VSSKLTAHALADLIPAMTEDEYAQLKADIAEHGLHEPIVLCDGQILDGRHRYRACLELGIEPETRTYDGDAPLAYVVSANIHRRHLTESQRSALAVELRRPLAEEAARRKAQAPGQPRGRKQASLHLPGEEETSPLDRESAALAARVVGVSRASVYRAERVARLAPDLFEQVRAGELDVKRADRMARARQEEAGRWAASAAEAEAAGIDPPEIRRGDFREVLADIPDGSVALVLTDPPYGEEYLPLWDDLGAFAARVLRPGGSLVAYSGQAMLPAVLGTLDRHLRYWWVLSLLHHHGPQQMQGKYINARWKPLLWFVRERRGWSRYVDDVLDGSRPRKELHPWAQGDGEIEPLILALTDPGDLVVDPFAGSGTVGVAATRLGRRFVGAEVNG